MPAAPSPNLEVADMFRGEAASFRSGTGRRLSLAQKRVVRCHQRLPHGRLGGHVEACDHCDHQQISYNSCRNRHCPKCQAHGAGRMARAARGRTAARSLTSTSCSRCPHEMAALALQNKRLVYGMLFEAASQTIAEDGRQSPAPRRHESASWPCCTRGARI